MIELLVVVAIIALLISILLPSLARAREGARATVCLSNLKQMGNAVLLYVADNRMSLPGPVHNPIYHDTDRLLDAERMSGDPPQSLYYSVNLPAYIARYLGTSSKSASFVDKVGACPTSERIPKVPSDVPTLPLTYRLPAGHYIANTGGGVEGLTNTKRSLNDKNDTHPYYETDPGDYFGWTNVPCPRDWYDASAHPPNGAARPPRSADKVKRQADEWMIADLWYWEAGFGAFGGSGPVGTWMYPRSSSQTSSIYYNGLKVPSYPYHYMTKSFLPNVTMSNDKKLNSPRLTSGKTNAVYFDGHAASVRVWRGTVNPKF